MRKVLQSDIDVATPMPLQYNLFYKNVIQSASTTGPISITVYISNNTSPIINHNNIIDNSASYFISMKTITQEIV